MRPVPEGGPRHNELQQQKTLRKSDFNLQAASQLKTTQPGDKAQCQSAMNQQPTHTKMYKVLYDILIFFFFDPMLQAKSGEQLNNEEQSQNSTTFLSQFHNA